jgi:hypothetical protein
MKTMSMTGNFGITTQHLVKQLHIDRLCTIVHPHNCSVCWGGLQDSAEFGRIGRYYAAESMLVWDEKRQVSTRAWPGHQTFPSRVHLATSGWLIGWAWSGCQAR